MPKRSTPARRRRPKVTEVEAIEIINRCIDDLGSMPTLNAYSEWAAAQDPPEPPVPRLRAAHPPWKWTDWLRAAGHDPSHGPQRVWSNEQLRACLDQCAQDLGGRPTTSKYTAWAKDRHAPTVLAITRRLGPWKGVTDRYRVEAPPD